MQTVGIRDVVQLLEQCREYFLKNLTGLILVETRAPGNRVNQALVSINQNLPGRLVTFATRIQTLSVSGLHVSTDYTDNPDYLNTIYIICGQTYFAGRWRDCLTASPEVSDEAMTTRPSLLFYYPHSLAMGHLVRSLALADSLADRFHVMLLNGGRMPKGLVIPPGVQVINLPPLGIDETNQLVSHDRRISVERALDRRRKMMRTCFDNLRPAVIVL